LPTEKVMEKMKNLLNKINDSVADISSVDWFAG
jgi:hypothetical protein